MFSNTFGAYQQVECGLCTIRSGRRSEVQPVPLLSVDVTSSVVHAVAQVQVTQVFINRETEPIEAVYYFPVDSNGAVTLFEAEIEGRKIKGVAKAHEEAKEEYEKAVKESRTAFLGSENKPDIFTVKVGCLKPGQQAKITLGYVSEVKNEKGSNSIRFFIPTTVAPRYVPAESKDSKSEELKNMQFTENSPAPMSIKVNVSIQGDIKSIDSPTHKIRITSKGPIPEKKHWTKAAVELEGKTTDMDRDFVLLIIPAEEHKPRLYLEKLEKSMAVMVHLIPSFKLDEQKAELIFVLDRSGSMDGKSIELAKKALALFLHSLPADCYFNIVGFGSSYELLFPTSVKYDDNSLQKAEAYAKDLDAAMGGTEILEPLKVIYNAEPVPGYLRQIFVITDGQVSNTDEVIGLTKAKAHESRVFSLGIGNGASHHLVEGLAQAGGGMSAFVTYNETIDKKVLQQLKDALQPSLTNVQLTWEGVTPAVLEQTASKPEEICMEKTLMGYGKPKNPEKKTDSVAKKTYFQAPENIPPIFDGTQLVAFGIFRNCEEMPTGLTIKADSPDGPLSLLIDLSEENDLGNTGMIHKLAAVKIIRETELKVAALGFDARGQEQDNSWDEATLKGEIIEIAVEEGLASKYTSFVAVDTASDDKPEQNWTMQTRLVPSQLANGWGGQSPMHRQRPRYFSPSSDSSPECCNSYECYTDSGTLFGPSLSFYADEFEVYPCSASSSMASSSFNACFNACEYASPAAPDYSPPCESFAFPAFTSVPGISNFSKTSSQDEEKNFMNYKPPRITRSTPTAKSNPNDVLHEVIIFQSFDGSFQPKDDLITALDLDVSSVKQTADANNWDLKAWVTALALAFLSEKLGDHEGSWELVAVKARKWLEKSFPAILEALTEAADQLFKPAGDIPTNS